MVIFHVQRNRRNITDRFALGQHAEALAFIARSIAAGIQHRIQRMSEFFSDHLRNLGVGRKQFDPLSVQVDARPAVSTVSGERTHRTVHGLVVEQAHVDPDLAGQDRIDQLARARLASRVCVARQVLQADLLWKPGKARLLNGEELGQAKRDW